VFPRYLDPEEAAPEPKDKKNKKDKKAD